MSDDPKQSGLDQGGQQVAYQVLARKYRPQNFEDLIGHGPMVRTLRNAFASGRIAHAYVLTGVRGVGKTTTARILARALNYVGPDGADNGPTIDITETGLHCKAIAESRHPDVLEMDAASRTGVGDIRELIEGVRYAPVEARYKVYIIDEVHMLSTAAFNALLKTLEEPPPHVKFIFATTEIRKLPVTVLSRCQRFDLRRIEPDVLFDHLKGIAAKEGVELEDEGLRLIVRAAEGSVRDGLSILDQALIQHHLVTDRPAAAVSTEDVRAMLGLADRGQVWDLFNAVFEGDAKRALELFRDQYNAGADPSVVLRDMLELVHLVTRTKAAGAEAASHGVAGEADASRALAAATGLQINVLTRAWSLLMKGMQETSFAPDAAACAEIVLIKLAFAADLPTPDEALRRLKAERGAGGDKTSNQGSDRGGNGAKARSNGSGRGHDMAPDQRVTGLDSPAINPAETNGGNERGTTAGYRHEASHTASHRSEKDGDDGPALRRGATSGASPAPLRLIKTERANRHTGDHLSSFADIVRLAGQKRDAKLKVELESYVHLVSFAPGRIEMRLHPNAPRDLSGRLVQCLKEWTNDAWTVTLNASEQGAPTLRDARFAAVMANPLIEGLFAEFPDAEILTIRDSDPGLAASGIGMPDAPDYPPDYPDYSDDSPSDEDEDD